MFVSTGGFPNQPGWKIAERLLEQGHREIELSGGLFDPFQLTELKRLKADFEARLLLHNYLQLILPFPTLLWPRSLTRCLRVWTRELLLEYF